jgi:glycosyltransferase involved in cell wall biosynthesis
LKEEKFSIYPSVPAEDFYVGKKKENNQFHVLSVGRFVSLNAFELTLHSFIGFTKSLSDAEQQLCKLTLVDTGRKKELYQKIIKKNQAEDLVIIKESLDHESLKAEYQKATVFLFHTNEVKDTVIAEALSFGLPIICLENNDLNPFIDESSSICIPKQNYTATIISLKHALLKLYKIPHLTDRMSQQARKQFENKFSWESRGVYLQNIYNTLIT